MKSNSDHKSPSRFSTGVPVSEILASGLRLLTALVCLAAGFLIAWASSRMARRHGTSASQVARNRDPYVVIARSTPCTRSGPHVLKFGAAEGCAISVLRLGAKRSISDAQLATSDAG